ncbi:peroxisome biosynthesis protein [Rhizophagus clarus]|uniref:RING-type E3 ubiquitin transferase n=1 Tax=Rhizophagus clarus TaxID=94130 RepID=A0A8H3KTS8_9GLOM|nr:peroxisome biosynthesis protein [Rhizophagus clarus]
MSNSGSSGEKATPTTPQLSSNNGSFPYFPYAAQPDIIRANQKDVYYQQILEEQMTNVFRIFFGTRLQHQFQKEVNVISDLFYFCLTTLLGTQTLGEEYCDIMQISDSTKQSLPSSSKRVTLIFWHIIFPYLYTRGISELRKRTKPSWKKSRTQQIQIRNTKYDRLRESIYRLLPKLQTLLKGHVHSIHLAIFYFYGAYYCISKRATGIRYIFTRQLGPHEQRIGLIKGADDSLLNEDEEEDSEDESDLMVTSTEGLTPQEIAARKCILCLSPRKNTTATPCGHLFCWTCIVDCCNNKPECPLCRQYINISHLLPIYNY